MNDKCNYCKYARMSIAQGNIECRNLDLCIDNSLFDPIDEWYGISYIFEEKEKEMINHPSHYNQGKYEAIDVIEDWKLNFNLGNTIKYISRAGHKDDIIQDLKKASWYLNREIERLEKGE